MLCRGRLWRRFGKGKATDHRKACPLAVAPVKWKHQTNETYYKTIFASETTSQYIDIESLEYIESAIAVYEKFIKNKQRPNWSLAVLNDFAFVDFYIAQSTLDRMGVAR